MTTTATLPPPVAAGRHRAAPPPPWSGAVGLLTTYVILLFVVPSNVVIAGMGSLGRPSQLWGVLLLVVWVITRLQSSAIVFGGPRQPIKLVLGLLVVVALVSFAAALLRGQPADQVSPATTAMIRLLSWVGVVLVAADGLHTRNQVTTLLRRIVIVATCLAMLGLGQFVAGQSLLEWAAVIPGLEYEGGGVESRGQFTRASGTAVHPLEYTATMAGCIPLAVAAAVGGGYLDRSRSRWTWWLPPILLLAVSALAVSRSATIGLVVAAIASLPSLPRAYRWAVAGGAAAMMAALVAVVPGLLSTTLFLFSSIGEDSSSLSRTNALERLPDFVGPSPLIGSGFGTFMSRYYIFDNQWVITLIDLGALGFISLLGLAITAIWSAATAARMSVFADAQMIGRSIAAAVLTVAVLFFFFDGFSFSQAAGFFFLLVGLAAAVRTVGVADRRSVGRRQSRPAAAQSVAAAMDGSATLPGPITARRAEL